MTIYKGRVGCRDLAMLIHSILLNEGYTEISSEVSNDGRVYKSPSTNGEDLFYIQIKDPRSIYLQVGVYEIYTPDVVNGIPGKFLNGIVGNPIMWNRNASPDRCDVNYVINATSKRVIVYVEGQRAEPNTVNSLTYIGLPKRASSIDKQGTFAGLAYTAWGPYDNHNIFYSLRNRSNSPLFPYNMEFYMPRRSYGWGGKLFFSPILIGSRAEGNRGTLEGIMILEKTDASSEISPGDTFSHEGKNYMLISPTSYSHDTLHTGYDYLIEI